MTQTTLSNQDITDRANAHILFQKILDNIHVFNKTDKGEELQCNLEGIITSITDIMDECRVEGWNNAKGI